MNAGLEVEVASVRTALAAALAEKGPDYVYDRPEILRYDDESDKTYKDTSPGCVYLAPVFDEDDTVVDHVPSCLWGHVLLTLGMDKDELLKHNEDEGISSSSIPVPWQSEVISAAAAEAQMIQDGGGTWAAAVAKFEATLKERGVKL